MRAFPPSPEVRHGKTKNNGYHIDLFVCKSRRSLYLRARFNSRRFVYRVLYRAKGLHSIGPSQVDLH